jgi:hypothetical protein
MSSINHSILSGLGSPGRHRQASKVGGHVREQGGPQPNFTHFYLSEVNGILKYT